MGPFPSLSSFFFLPLRFLPPRTMDGLRYSFDDQISLNNILFNHLLDSFAEKVSSAFLLSSARYPDPKSIAACSQRTGVFVLLYRLGIVAG